MIPPIDQYEAATEWWRLLWDRIAAESWQSLFYNQHDDGNPIFSAVSFAEKRVVRIIQFSNNPREEDEDDEDHLDFWWDMFDAVMQELVVCCCDSLSDEDAILVENTIRAWVSGTITFGSKFHSS